MWLNDSTGKKWRSDSLEARIYAAAEAEAKGMGFTDQEAALSGMDGVFRVMNWLYAKPQAVVREMVADAFGIETSEAALSYFWQRLCSPFLSERMRRLSSTVRALEDDLEAEGMEEATRKLMAQKAFDVLSSPDPDISDVVRLHKELMSAKKQRTDERRLALLEEKARQNDASREVLGTDLSPEEQTRRLREILK